MPKLTPYRAMAPPSPRRKKKNETEPGSPHWMTTFSDMATLLLTFFVLLFSMSVIDLERFQRMVVGIQASFLGSSGIMELSPLPVEGTQVGESEEEAALAQAYRERQQRLEEIKAAVETFLGDAGLTGTVEVRMEERGVVMEMPEQIFFERARADLRPEARQVLDRLSELFRRLDEQVIVEGHTCNLPINEPEFPSNWELSVIRAVRVTRYLIEVQGLEPQRFTAAGYGEYRPLDTNDTPEGRARNRRVSIVIAL